MCVDEESADEDAGMANTRVSTVGDCVLKYGDDVRCGEMMYGCIG